MSRSIPVRVSNEATKKDRCGLPRAHGQFVKLRVLFLRQEERKLVLALATPSGIEMLAAFSTTTLGHWASIRQFNGSVKYTAALATNGSEV